MTIENILAMVAIAVITNFILNFKGFCENIDYIKTRVGRDKELTKLRRKAPSFRAAI